MQRASKICKALLGPASREGLMVPTRARQFDMSQVDFLMAKRSGSENYVGTLAGNSLYVASTYTDTTFMR